VVVVVVVVVEEEEQEEVYHKSIGVAVVVLLTGITMGFQVLGFPSSCTERSSHVFVFCTLLAGCTIWRDCKTLIQPKRVPDGDDDHELLQAGYTKSYTAWNRCIFCSCIEALCDHGEG
jgi:hypothetical protein